MQPLWLPLSSLNQPWESSIFFSLYVCRSPIHSVLHHGKQDNMSLSTKSINPTKQRLYFCHLKELSEIQLPAHRVCGCSGLPEKHVTHHLSSETTAGMPTDIIMWDPWFQRELRLLSLPPCRGSRRCKALFLQSWTKIWDPDLQAKKDTDYIFMIPVSDFINSHNFL